MTDNGNYLAFGTVIGRTPDTDDPTPASQVSYAVRGVMADGSPSPVVPGVRPMRWAGDDEEIHPAKVNTPCVFGRVGGQAFLIVPERPAIDLCTEAS